MNQLWSWQSLCRTTLEVAPFDGISRFRFKGSSEKFGVLSQRLPCVPLLNYELRPTSTASTHAERSAVPSMRTWTVPLGRFEVEDFAKTNTTVPVRLMTRSPAAISNGKSFPCWNPKRSDCSCGVRLPEAYFRANSVGRTRRPRIRAAPTTTFPSWTKSGPGRSST